MYSGRLLDVQQTQVEKKEKELTYVLGLSMTGIPIHKPLSHESHTKICLSIASYISVIDLRLEFNHGHKSVLSHSFFFFFQPEHLTVYIATTRSTKNTYVIEIFMKAALSNDVGMVCNLTDIYCAHFRGTVLLSRRLRSVWTCKLACMLIT